MNEPPTLTWDPDGLPRSGRFGDVYFSKDGGLAESRAVFLAGCGLPAAWAGRAHFTIAELGFGTGLNIAAALELWRRAGPPGGRLHLFSVEAWPLSADEAGRALAIWPELASVSAALLARWPSRAPGFHRVDLPDFGAVLDLAVMDAAEALAAWSGRADAWFLDGFAPAANPDMWTPALMALVARRSAPDARAATYTVAGAVRRGLGEAGFTVNRAAGFGRKRQRLEAVRPGPAIAEASARTAAIIGAGIAGAALARAFAALGAAVTVFDPGGPGAGASGNPAALVTPRFDAGLGPTAGLFADAFARSARLMSDRPEAIIARGALQLERTDRDARRFAAIAASDLFEPGALTPLDAADVSARLGQAAPGGVLIRDGLVIEPAALLPAWLGGAVRRQAVASIAPADHGGWWLLDERGERLAEAAVVCLAAGVACQAFAPDLPLAPVRGQVSLASGATSPAPAAFGGYVIPTRTGLLFGATHDRGQTGTEVRNDDHRRNLATLAATLPDLAARLTGQALGGRAGVRATTPDHLPLAGALPGASPGLFVLGGLGSRGYALAPLLAEHIAAIATATPSPLRAPLAALVDPGRFQERRRPGSRLSN